MKRLTDKQKALLQELAPEIAEYRRFQAQADSIEVVDYKSADEALYWQIRARDTLYKIEFWVTEAYAFIPYKATYYKAIDAFMKLVMEGK